MTKKTDEFNDCIFEILRVLESRKRTSSQVVIKVNEVKKFSSIKIIEALTYLKEFGYIKKTLRQREKGYVRLYILPKGRERLKILRVQKEDKNK